MIRLSDFPTRAPSHLKKSDTKEKTDVLVRRIGDLQHMLYAEEKHSILVVFQGMDASGKDGATRKVFRYCSPTGVSAYAFRKPSDFEFAHDFLWRVHHQAPPKGQIRIFNRSHYEDILIQRVHKWIDEKRVAQRMEAINEFERLVQFDNDTTVVKFYMHLSRKRQHKKLVERIENPRKNWKHNKDDWKEALLWDDYMRCYEDVINWSEVPWHIIPVDQRWYRDYIVARIMVKVLENLEMKLPVLKPEDTEIPEYSG
jgi:PPK2 family polyphosphate:nucleotide phosphotransferase